MGGRRGGAHSILVRGGRPNVRIVGAIDRAHGSFAPDSALEFFPGLLERRLLDWIRASSEKNRARDANDGGEGFQALRILKEVISDK